LSYTELRLELKRMKIKVVEFANLFGYFPNNMSRWKEVPLPVQMNVMLLKSMCAGDRAKFLVEWLEHIERDRELSS
jgi:hypothetical protein